MYLTNHVSTAILLSQLPMNPVAAFGLGLATHYLLDIVPHGDNMRRYPRPKLNSSVANLPDYDSWQIEGALDVWAVAGVVAAVGIFGDIREPWTFLPLILGAVLPDFLMGLQSVWKTKLIHYPQILHYYVHILLPDVPAKVGRIAQFFYAAAALTAYFTFIA